LNLSNIAVQFLTVINSSIQNLTFGSTEIKEIELISTSNTTVIINNATKLFKVNISDNINMDINDYTDLVSILADESDIHGGYLRLANTQDDVSTIDALDELRRRAWTIVF
jgi:hypothetical protein